MSKIVKNNSQGYGYKYSNLADLHRAGINIPKMRVKPTEYGDYIEYLDDKGEWQTGAKVVPFEAKGMNASQIYGAALTYARRYTVQMAEAVACDDDDEVERAKPVKSFEQKSEAFTQAAKQGLKPTPKQLAWLRKFYEEKEGLSYAEARDKAASFETVQDASAEIEKLMDKK